MALHWLLENIPKWHQSAVEKLTPKPSHSHQVQPAKEKSQPDPLERVKHGRVIKSPSAPGATKRRREVSKESDPPPKYIYTIPPYREDSSELSTASLVTTPSGSSLDSEERYQPKHKITENILDFVFEREASIQRQQLLIKQHSGLTELEVKLFNQISMVGLEPLLPLSFQHDFPTFPDPMFINTADSKAPMPFLCESRGSEYAAIRALRSLLPLGTRARNRRQCKLRPEPTIARHIQSYYRWAEHDAMLHIRDYIPALVVEKLEPGDSNFDVVDRAEKRLQKLAKQYRARYSEAGEVRAHSTVPKPSRKGKAVRLGKVRVVDLESFRTFPPVRDPKTNIDVTPHPDNIDPSSPPNKSLNKRSPILYGVLIWHTIVKFVSYDTSRVKITGKPGAKGYKEDWSLVTAAHVADFDFSEEDPDVWNALSVASLVVWVRDQLSQEGWAWGERMPGSAEDLDT